MNRFWLVFLLLLGGFYAFGQVPGGSLSGNFMIIAQTYKQDTFINARSAPEKLLLNSYANFYYHNGGFTAGLRYEGYLNTLQGYNPKNDGFGFPFYFMQYQNEKFDFTFGSFYDQFGNGLVFRAYEDKNIGYDNAINGVRIKFEPVQGIYLKGIIGRQRLAFSKNNLGFSNVIYKGLIRGLDGEINLNETFDKLSGWKHVFNLGFSFVSKYQPADDHYVSLGDTLLKLQIPENVAAFSSRLNYSFKNFIFSAEYAFKSADPSADNNFIYKNGNALFTNFSYSRSGLGILVSFLAIDNFSFRSDRNATINDLNINYIPDITRNHTYSLAAIYPYASQNTSEVGVAVEITKKFKRKTFLGGKYGTNLSINFSRMHDLAKLPVAPQIDINQSGTLGYLIDFQKVGELLYQDFNVQVEKKVSKMFKFILLYQNLFFNYAVLRGKPNHESVFANTFVSDLTFKLNRKNALRTEFQALFTKQDMGNWASALAEYTVSPHWFFTVSDEYNYGNPVKKVHYYNFAFGYKVNATRIQLGYGRQREGVVCIGGVCREVPAANGFNFVISSTF